MKNLILGVGLFLAYTCCWSQEAIELYTLQEGDTITFMAKNTSMYPMEVSLWLEDAQGLKGILDKESKVILPDSTDTLKRVEIVDNFGYETKYNFVVPDNILSDKNFKIDDESKLNSGIVVFTKDGCPRCNYTTSYLLDKKIPFKMINISQKEENNILMWSLIKSRGTKLDVNTPVIVVNGEVSYSHENLTKFVKQLEKNF